MEMNNEAKEITRDKVSKFGESKDYTSKAKMIENYTTGNFEKHKRSKKEAENSFKIKTEKTCY